MIYDGRSGGITSITIIISSSMQVVVVAVSRFVYLSHSFLSMHSSDDNTKITLYRGIEGMYVQLQLREQNREKGQSEIAIANTNQINYKQSYVFKNKGDNPFTFLLVVYVSDIKQDGCYASNVNHKNYLFTHYISLTMWLK